MSPGKQQSAFDQVSEFDRGRIVDYRDCVDYLSGKSCITLGEDRQIVRMAETDRSVTSRPVAQHIESVMHLSVSARTIQRRLQQSSLSVSRLLLGLP
ncbi:HTH_Tnp_Tc3_2 domain-containing protein [Trichonephila clavipes]|nr:HTH_Tnp_Tc3_2 domain-containing protein [Trichonephila clavipes]